METKIIELTQDWREYKSGDVLKVSAEIADSLVEAGAAKLFDPAAEVKAQAEAKAASDAQATAIGEIVKSEIAKTQAEVIGKVPAGSAATTRQRSEDDPKWGFRSFGEFAYQISQEKAGAVINDARFKITPMQEGLSSDGGFLVPPEFRASLMMRTYDQAALAGRCQRIPMASAYTRIPYIAESSRIDGSRQGGILGYWISEGAQKTDTKTALGQLELKLNEVAVLVFATDQLLQDSAISLEPLLTTLAANEIAFQVDTKVISGSGAGQPLGIMNCPALVTVAKETGQPANTLLFENLINMYARMWGRCRGNAVWFINQNIEPQLFTMAMAVGTAGVPVYLPANNVSGTPYGTLFGRPVVPIEQAETLGTPGDIIFADMSQYLFGQKAVGIEAAMSIHLRFDYDLTAFRFILRCDGQPWWASALTPYKGSATLSPFVALAVRA